MSIQAIPTASVAKICSGQVILDLSTAVKELVENALDAGATTVEVRLREHGVQLIEVADNGKGVPPEDHAALALKYHTSKISQFNDLESLHTYGFRGEALSSLSALGELSVITRTANQAAATRLEFDRDGRLTSSSSVARAVGTTVAVKDLFAALPVRRQEFVRNVRREVAKLKLLLQQYAIMSTQAQLFASDQGGKAVRTTLVSTSTAGSSMLDRVSAVLGSKVAALLVPIEVKLQEEGVTITGLVSRAGCGVKGEKLRQFCCINGRPVELPRAIKTLNDTYKSLYSSIVGLRPMAFLAFELPAGTFDINVTPDKRSVFMQREVAVVNALGQALQALWEPSRYSYAVNTTQAAFDSQRPSTAPQPAAAEAGEEADIDHEGAEPADEGDLDDAHMAANASTHDMQQQHREADISAECPAHVAAVGRSSSRVPGQDKGAAAGPPSLASFMIGASRAAPAPAQAVRPGSQQQGQAVSATATASASAEAVADAAASTGVKRLRPLEAALLGRKVPRAQLPDARLSAQAGPRSSSTPADFAVTEHSPPAAAEGSLDSCVVELDDGQETAGVQHVQPRGLQHGQGQPGGPVPLQAFQLGEGGSQLNSEAEQQAQVQNGAKGAGRDERARSKRDNGLSDQKQRSLAAFGFRVVAQPLPMQQQHSSQDGGCDQPSGSASPQHQEEPADASQQQEWRRPGTAVQKGGQQLRPAVSGPSDVSGDVELVDVTGDDRADDTGGGEGEEEGVTAKVRPQQQHQQLLDDGFGADGAIEGEDVAIVREHQQPARQGQQQRDHAAGTGRQPLLLDYSMQQLMADAQLRLQQLRLQQQQQRVAEATTADAAAPDAGALPPARHSGLTAASLQATGSERADVTSAGTTAASGGSGGGGGGTADAAAAAGDAATSELMRVFNKADFAAMQPVGQFNLGFIIAKLRDDLFIVDQHAADEKSTFERLMGSYTVNKQPLLQPRRLTTLTAMDQQTIREHMNIFKRNGFDFVERELQTGQQQDGGQQQQQLWSKPARGKAAATAAAAATAGQAAACPDGDLSPALGPGHRAAPAEGAGCGGDGGGGPQETASSFELLLSAVPVLKGGASGGGAMGEEALLELLDLIAAGETRPEDVRPKKVRDVLASRACRTSIMIGSPLTRQQQGRILARLAQLDAPFNCPHGRPTMRHLAVLPEQQQACKQGGA